MLGLDSPKQGFGESANLLDDLAIGRRGPFQLFTWRRQEGNPLPAHTEKEFLWQFPQKFSKQKRLLG